MIVSHRGIKSKCLSVMSALLLCHCAYIPWTNTVQSPALDKRLETALETYKREPEVAEHRKDLLVTRELAVSRWNEEAEHAIDKGDLDEAKKLYERVIAVLPEDTTAQQGLVDVERAKRLHAKLVRAQGLKDKNATLDAKNVVHQVLMEEPNHAEAKSLSQAISERLPTPVSEPAKLKPPHQRPVSLELRDANLKVVFDALSKATGINFILDKDIKPDTKATIFLKKMRIDDAIDMVLTSNGLQKKTLSENTVLVYPNTLAKLKDYQDLMIRNFYLINASAKQVSSLLKRC